MDALWSSLAGIALLFVIFLPLERLFAAHGQRVFRKEWSTDLLFCLGQYFLWTAPVVFVLQFVYVNSHAMPFAGVRESFAALPFWVQFGIVILGCDVSIYWAHRLSHSVPLLWRFHRVHHTAERLDWIAAFREHPFDNL